MKPLFLNAQGMITYTNVTKIFISTEKFNSQAAFQNKKFEKF